ncbi:MAG TPA: HD domain-containing phosphohydrolase [Gemmataceae bacterium]|nr:HD domain-containing phosphohydrolase [Gemmataceae bacterium]
MTSAKIVLSGMGPKLEGLKWESDKLLRIGRQGNVDIALRDFSIDRVQAEVCLAGARWIIRDLSQNEIYPTLVNGTRVGRGEQPLTRQDVLQFGKLSLKVTVLEIEGSAGDVSKRRPSDGVQGDAVASPGSIQDQVSGFPDDHPVAPQVIVQAPVRQEPLTSRNAPEQEGIKTSGAFVKVQARTHQSWDQALEVVAFGAEQRTQQGQSMLTLLRANHHLVHIANLEELVGSILQDALRALGAQRGSIALFDQATGRLELKAHQAPGLPPSIKWIYSKTLAERCFHVGESLLCRDVNADDDLLMARSVRQGSMASIICALLRTPRKRLGILQLDRGPFQEPFTENDLYLVDAIAASAAIGIESAQLVEQQREQFIQTVTTLARAVSMRDQYTGDHTQRVTAYALLLAEELKLPATEKYQIQIGTPLHDIGKIGIDDAILRKPGKLTAAEFENMKTHTIKGASILESICSLGPMIPIVRHHHERWDGTGYPDRLGKNDISLIARIVAVADTFDAMTSNRPYRAALAADMAFVELLQQSGTHFDPNCVQGFLRQRRKVEQLLTGR